jgi:hypothetical protein
MVFSIKYRFFDDEIVAVDDGGQFGWDNGCANYYEPGTNKCGEKPSPFDLVWKASSRSATAATPCEPPGSMPH